jgi:hypothetical protein
MKTTLAAFVVAIVTVTSFLISAPLRAGISRGGEGNTNQGVDALHNNTSGSDNSAFGYQTLFSNTTGHGYTAVGYQALFNINDGGVPGVGMTAIGYQALYSATRTSGMTAVGYQALFSNTSGFGNTAVGWESLSSNTSGSQNAGLGVATLSSNTTGSRNTATGNNTLGLNTTGSFNTADGQIALDSNTTGSQNTAIGRAALISNTTGNNNIALGNAAGANLDIGDNNIDIGNAGLAGESNTIRVGDPAVQTATFFAGIFGAGTDVAGLPVYVDASGKLGTLPSSARFKEDVKAMTDISEEVFSLKPVTFRYKTEFTKNKASQFGLLAEEVAQVDPNLIVRDAKGEIQSVRYEAVNAMVLNELIKEHHRVQEQQKQIDELTAHLKEQSALIEKVTARIELDRPAPRTVAGRKQ